MLTLYFLLGFRNGCVRDRAASFSEHERFAGKRAQLQHDRLQDLFQGLFEELPEGGVSWKLYIWQGHHTCSGHRLLQHPTRLQATSAAQLHLAGKTTCRLYTCMETKQYTRHI